MYDVAVVGGGPTGLMLAGELVLAGVDVVVLERRSTPELVGSRAGGFHSRTLEILDQRGIAERFVAEGQAAQAARFGDTTLDVSDFPTRFPYSLGLWQNHIERILLGWADELAVPIRRGVEVTALTQDATGVTVHAAQGEAVRAGYVVGTDGARSVVRRATHIDFVGHDASRSHLIAELEVRGETPVGVRLDDIGIHGLQLMEDGRTVRVVVTESRLGPSTEPTLADLADALRVVYGTDFGVHSPTWISRFTDATRQAAAYRDGRVLLAGDAAHIHHPAGGQGIGLGIQDAVNLGWKLAQVVNGISAETLLDTYHAERQPAAARALQHSMAQSVVQRGDARTEALRTTIDDLLGFDGPRALLAGLISGLDVVYDVRAGVDHGATSGDRLTTTATGDADPSHPLLGRRMPDLDLVTVDGAVRVFSLLHRARPALVTLGEPDAVDLAGWAGRVQRVDATYDGPWELPVLGAVPAPSAVLVRPDGHVAWVGDGTQAGLHEALAHWFGRGADPQR